MKTFLVIPTIRNLDFLTVWGQQLSDTHLVIIEDRASKQIHTPADGFKSVFHFTWGDIASEFGENGWIFSRRNAGIRSYGFWKAYQMGADAIITLDDDCYPVDNEFVAGHLKNLQSFAPEGWFPTFPHPDYLYTRGFPYDVRDKRKVVISHGLWFNKMDMDARTQSQIGDVNIPPYPPVRQFIPPGMFFPMSSMNLAFSREVTPLMYFPLMGRDPDGKLWGFDRFDDIWAGVFAKKILDHLGLSVMNGSPYVDHRKASDVQQNLIKEKNGLVMNERLWESVNEVHLTKSSPAACYGELAARIRFPKTDYFTRLRQAMTIWANYFSL